MEQMIEFARGPLFALTFGIMVLGLARLVVIQVSSLAVGKGRRLRKAPWRSMLQDAASWALPFRHFIKGTVLFSSTSFVLHIGLIVVPLLLAEHVVLWEAFLRVQLPAIGRGVADVLTLTTLACLGVLLACRLFVRRQRAASRPMDCFLLVAIMVPFATGYLALHPGVNPFRWDVVMLVHLLSAEFLFLLVPSTKLAHVVTIVFDRISAVHWQLRPGAGDQVAEALFGSEAKV